MEAQLIDEFEVRRDKSEMNVHDDLYDFMSAIANSDNVIIILTSDYVKYLSCMLEISYLMSEQIKKGGAYILNEYGSLTITELCEKSKLSKAVAHRYVRNLMDKGVVQAIGTRNSTGYTYSEKQ